MKIMKYLEQIKQHESVIKYDFNNLVFRDTIVAYRRISSIDSIAPDAITKTIDDDMYVLDVGKIGSVNKSNNRLEEPVYYGVRFSKDAYYYISPKYIVFASDRTKDAIDHIKMMMSANKYNL